MMKNPEAGDEIQGTGGLRKLRFADERKSLKAMVKREIAARSKT